MNLRSASPPPQRKKPSPPPLAAEGSVGDEAIAESMTLVKRNRAPAQSPVAVAVDDDEGIIDLTVGREREDAAGGATTETAQPRGELYLPDMSLIGDDATLKEFLISLNKIA
ncbi:hypothetical protein Dimus_026858, partial [Dionaea muscipula]